jgi:hypothetical protein
LQARLTGKAGGIEDLRIAEYPGPLGIHDASEIERNVEATLLDRIIEGLTRAGEGAAAAQDGARDPRAIVFTGSQEEINRHFIVQEWSDGLPVVPPTIERVERFLQFTDRAPDEEIAIMPGANLRATPWTIAVNAVMAGCEPAHMQVLIAAAEALADEHCKLASIGTSSGSFPYVLINGPIARKLGIASEAQLVSRGPNPAIGRAVGLIVRNIGGFRPGATYMGTFGYPPAFAIAENEAASPWEPFHVGQGFDRSDSTVTIGVTNNFGPSPAPYDTADKPGAQTAIELLCKEITKKTRLFNYPGRGPHAEEVMITLLISPSVANSLADAGYSKADLRRLVYENCTMRLGDFEWVFKYTTTMRMTLKARVEEGVFPAEFLGGPDDIVRVLSSPDILHIVVCGDPNRNRVMVLEGGHTLPTTKKIR